MSEQKCTNCKHVKEHVATVLPFQVLEKIADKPLRIRGVAMCTGMSRNFNIYTPEELQAFSSKLSNAPVYIEHVAVPNAVGKVTKTDWDGHSLLYEAEIYDDQTAEKIRKGLVQHVSVGADYEAVDLVDGRVPHGLHNAELSLVAVPGIPETNVHVLEKLVDTKVIEAREADAKELEKLQSKLSETEGKLADTTNKLSDARKTIEDLRKQLPGGGLLKNPPKMIAVSEATKLVEAVLPSPMIQRSWGLGPQRMCQELRRVVKQLEQKTGGS
jgi:Caudovirus prohead protease.